MRGLFLPARTKRGICHDELASHLTYACYKGLRTMLPVARAPERFLSAVVAAV